MPMWPDCSTTGTKLSMKIDIVSIFVGSWVDQRREKRPLLIVADLLRGVVLATIPVAYLLGALTTRRTGEAPAWSCAQSHGAWRWMR